MKRLQSARLKTAAMPAAKTAPRSKLVVDADASTKERILAAAEKHFVEHGLQHASVRAITRIAGANSASVVYYFGSKEELFAAVLNRCIEAMVVPRLRALDELEKKSGAAPPPLRSVLRILAEPFFLNRANALRPAAVYARFYGRMYAEPNDVHRRVVRKGFAELQKRFLAALARNLPNLPLPELTWRLVMILTALAYVGAEAGNSHSTDNPYSILRGVPDLTDEQLLEIYVESFCGMLTTPSTSRVTSK
jgi:AcrR family transcriptional regulator